MSAVANSIEPNSLLPANDAVVPLPRRFVRMLDIAVLLGALLIFLLFLALLTRVVFPEGTRLGDPSPGGNTASFATDRSGTVDVVGGSGDSFGGFIAQLGDIRRDVKVRPADSVAWRTAREGLTVHSRDAVQTFANSRARVDFTKDNELRIGQNSLVVFRSGAADPFLARREPAIVLMDGELTGTVRSEYGSLGVEFPAGLVELTAAGQSQEDVDFRVGVNPDGSSTVAVYSGQADVNIAGEHHQVAANQGLTIAKDGGTSGARSLPSLPLIREPYDNKVVKYLETPPRVKFRWGEVSGAQKYRLEIATDRRFDEILVDEYLEEVSFVHGNLSSGDYYWRIRARDGWIEGPASMPRRLSVVRDSVPPKLELRPVEEVFAGRYIVRGRTVPGARVFVLGQPVKTSPDGNFEFLFQPEPGTHSIVVESIDAVGNAAYSSQVFHVPGRSGRSE
ncbi:MAG: hypothetical protein KJO95_05900 [Gammaproteobacteria bacterium]|nr:hypothetical protein [Gammaproteobacteria bacterium]